MQINMFFLQKYDSLVKYNIKKIVKNEYFEKILTCKKNWDHSKIKITQS